VAKALRGLQLCDAIQIAPRTGDKLYREGKEVGHVTSALVSPAFKNKIALGYVRREHNQIGTELVLRTAGGEFPARIIELPALR
jgi:glycine cleavage system aminomethyltransferase T